MTQTTNFILALALLALAGLAAAQNTDQCVEYTIENNLVLFTAQDIPFDFQTSQLACPRAQNEFWMQYGGKGSACWREFLNDGWDCLKAVARYTGSSGCPRCMDGVGQFACSGLCDDVVRECPAAVALGNCFAGSDSGEPLCFGGDSNCIEWEVDEAVLEAQTGVSSPEGSGAGELVGGALSVLCFAVFALMLAGGV